MFEKGARQKKAVKNRGSEVGQDGWGFSDAGREDGRRTRGVPGGEIDLAETPTGGGNGGRDKWTTGGIRREIEV